MGAIKRYLLILISCFCYQADSQELFTYTEPASNMPAHSLGIRLNNWFMDDAEAGKVNYHLIPELMWGVNKNLMLHAEGFLSNREGGFSAEGGAVYAKYRFYTNDKVYRHFRLAVFGRLSSNNSVVHQEELDINGHNSGYDLGFIGTQLLHKTALSASVYYEHTTNNAAGNEFPTLQSDQAMNYTLSAGRLLLPKAYTGFKQTNLNIMAELLGQKLLDNDKSFLDAAVALQLIFNSQTRVDIGYKREIYSTMQRTAPNGFLIRVEHLLFNVF